METPLKSDGNNLGFTETSSHIRFTYFDKTLKRLQNNSQINYSMSQSYQKELSVLKGAFVILEFKENHLFIIKRASYNDFVCHGNTIRIFEAIVYKSKKTTHIGPLKSFKISAFFKKNIVV
jgi:hypothetical protein